MKNSIYKTALHATLLFSFFISTIKSMEPESYITIVGNQNYEVHTHREIIENIPAMKAKLNEKTNKILLASCDLPPISNKILSKTIFIAHKVYTDRIQFSADNVPYFIHDLPKVIGEKYDIKAWETMTHVWYALKSFGFAWAHGAKPFLCANKIESQFSSCTFNASQLNLKHIAPFCLIQNALYNVSTIDFSHNALTSISKEMFPCLPHLEILSINNNHITELNDGCFEKLFNLRVINLQENNLHDFPEGAFNGLNNLESIYFQANPVTNSSISRLKNTFGCIKNLKVLLMTGNRYYNESVQKVITNALPGIKILFDQN